MMKRHICILSVAAFALSALVSCNKYEVAEPAYGVSLKLAEVTEAGEPAVRSGEPVLSEQIAEELWLSASVSDNPVTIEGESETRGTNTTTASFSTLYGTAGFGVYAEKTGDAATVLFNNATFTKSGNEWTPGSAISWPSYTSDWYYWAPKSAATLASDNKTFTFSTPATNAATGEDILVGKTMSVAAGAVGPLAISFGHALCEVKFVSNEGMPAGTVTELSIGGIALTGTYDFATGAWGGQSNNGSIALSLSKAVDAGSGTALTDDTQTFFVIPQTCAAGASVSITIGGETKTIALPENFEFQAGKLVTFTLGKDPATYTFELVDPVDATKSFMNTTSDESVSISLTSTKTKGAEVTPADWVIKSVQVGDADPQTIDATSFDNVGGLSAEQADGGTLSIKAASRSGMKPSTHDYWVNQNPVRTDKLDWSPEDWSSSKATASNPLDLSKFNFQTETTGNPMTTANCYVIRHAGTYKLPLVYGNAVVNGNENFCAYYPNYYKDIPDGDIRTETIGINYGNFRLIKFQNHLGNGITSAFIENNTTDGQAKSEDNAYITAQSTAIVWQDKAEVVKNVQIVGTPNSDGSYDAASVRYLQFTISQNDICQNNALIAVMGKDVTDIDEDGDKDEDVVLWSWHIWTTNDPALLSDPISVWNISSPSIEYKFFPLYNLGWIDAENYPSRVDVKIVLSQKKSGEEISISVKQNAVIGASNGCWYQFGRKDPRCTTNTPAQGEFTESGSRGSTIDGAIRNPGEFYLEKLSGQEEGATLDWCKTRYLNLWTGKKSEREDDRVNLDQDPNMIKTVYDPSPVGYKMPAKRAFTGFTIDGETEVYNPSGYNVDGSFNSGYHFYTKPGRQGDIVYFPAAGEVAGSSGNFQFVGSAGLYWSAVAKSEYSGASLYFHSNAVYPDYGQPRAWGCSVRPVTEPRTTDANSQDYSGHPL